MGFWDTVWAAVLGGMIVAFFAGVPAICYFLIGKRRNRQRLIAFLRWAGSKAEIYRRALLTLLAWARQFYGAAPLGMASLSRSVHLALVYPIVFLSISYLNGSENKIGLLPIFSAIGVDYNSQYVFSRYFDFSILVFLIISSVLLGRNLKLFDSMANKIDIGIFKGIRVCRIIFAISMSYTVYIYYNENFAMLILIYSFSMVNLSAGYVIFSISVANFFGGNSLVLLFIFAFCFGRYLGMSFLIYTALFITAIAKLIFPENSYAQLTILIHLILLIVLPLVNAAFDHLSVGVSRSLLSMAARGVPIGYGKMRLSLWLSTALEIIGDIVFALACLVGLAFFLPLTVEAVNGLLELGETRLNWEKYVEDAWRDPWGEGIAGVLMLVSTLVPTFLHVALAAVCYVSRPLVGLVGLGRKLAAIQSKPGDDIPVIWALICAAFAFVPAILIAFGAAWAGKRILDVLSRWMGEEGFAGLLYDAATYGGAQGASASAPIWLLALICVVGGLTIFVPRLGAAPKQN